MSTTLMVLSHFFSLDFGWLLQFVLDNLLWLFLFAASAVFFFEKKNWVLAIVFVGFWVFISSEFAAIVGWQLLSADFLAVNMIALVAVLTFAQYDSWGSKNLLLVNIVRFLVVLAFFNLFLV